MWNDWATTASAVANAPSTSPWSRDQRTSAFSGTSSWTRGAEAAVRGSSTGSSGS